jgi:hypothetical protein
MFYLLNRPSKSQNVITVGFLASVASKVNLMLIVWMTFFLKKGKEKVKQNYHKQKNKKHDKKRKQKSRSTSLFFTQKTQLCFAFFEKQDVLHASMLFAL